MAYCSFLHFLYTIHAFPSEAFTANNWPINQARLQSWESLKNTVIPQTLYFLLRLISVHSLALLIVQRQSLFQYSVLEMIVLYMAYNEIFSSFLSPSLSFFHPSFSPSLLLPSLSLSFFFLWCLQTRKKIQKLCRDNMSPEGWNSSVTSPSLYLSKNKYCANF